MPAETPIEKLAHTPTPWYVAECWDDAEITRYDPAASYEGPDRPDILFQVGNYGLPAMTRQDAAHIVRCVNAHDALVAALQLLMDAVDYTSRFGPRVNDPLGGVLPDVIIHQARAALALPKS